MNYTLIFQIVAFSLLFTRLFEPIQPIKDKIVEKYLGFVLRKKWFWMVNLIKPLSCSKCFSLWFTLLLTFDLGLAIVTSVITLIVDLIIKRLEDEQ